MVKDVSSGASAGATITTTGVSLSSDFTTTSGSFVDVTGLTITLTNVADGKYLGSCSIGGGVTGNWWFIQMIQNTTIKSSVLTSYLGSGIQTPVSLTGQGDTNGEVVKIQLRTGGGTTGTLYDRDGDSTFSIMEIS
jgi:hypothetical protein